MVAVWRFFREGEGEREGERETRRVAASVFMFPVVSTFVLFFCVQRWFSKSCPQLFLRDIFRLCSFFFANGELFGICVVDTWLSIVLFMWFRDCQI